MAGTSGMHSTLNEQTWNNQMSEHSWLTQNEHAFNQKELGIWFLFFFFFF